MPFLQPAEIQWMYICQKDRFVCVFDNIGFVCQSVDVKRPLLYVFMAVILCMTVLLAEVYTL